MIRIFTYAAGIFCAASIVATGAAWMSLRISPEEAEPLTPSMRQASADVYHWLERQGFPVIPFRIIPSVVRCDPCLEKWAALAAYNHEAHAIIVPSHFDDRLPLFIGLYRHELCHAYLDTAGFPEYPQEDICSLAAKGAS